MIDPVPHLDRLNEGSRKRQAVGDVFRMRLDGRYLFGRVVSTSAHIPPRSGSGSGIAGLLVYIYDTSQDSPEPHVDDLRPDRLLLPPAIVNRRGWLDGYFEFVMHLDLEPGDTLGAHCFRRAGHGRPDTYHDETGRRLLSKQEPCSVFGLGNHLTIEEAVRGALGLPAPTRHQDAPN
ncbi:MAG: immunity 26/phosphotriesterase HocA family protein [Actinobacteria bacterium]|nr:immunity 26/phosphotriesterase HocA family protein [Actinomycetota bacterium]MCG2807041.1 immunity 26/phosphotriesterase HocA family protein [Coriobacteriia bacterium]